MSEETPSGSGSRQTPETVEWLLSTVREALEMDVAFVSEFAEDRLVFRVLEGMRSPSDGDKAKASRSMTPTAGGY